MTKLERHNAKVRKWADLQPAKYRKTALAFGYRCDVDTDSFSGTLEWIAKKSRQRKGEGVCRKTLVNHLPAFERDGVITIERRRNGDNNMSSVYTVDFDKAVAEQPKADDMQIVDPWTEEVIEVAEPVKAKARPVDWGSEEPDLDRFIDESWKQAPREEKPERWTPGMWDL